MQYIEDKANGSAIISMLKKSVQGVIAVNPDGGKIARVNAVSPLIEAGNVYIPETEWTNDYINELVAFPNGKHDDEVDSTTQALNKLRTINADVRELTEEEVRQQEKKERTN